MNRASLLDHLADLVLAVKRPHPIRVAIDGFSASGKTKLGDDLVAPVERLNRTVIRASLDDFKRPWSESHLYDRTSGEGYYRNAYDYDSIHRFLLKPLGPGGDRRYHSVLIDPLSQVRSDTAASIAPSDAILLADGVFLFRPELCSLWDFRIFLDIDFELSLKRGSRRDSLWAGSGETAGELYRSRYIPSEQLYVSEVGPKGLADVIIDNTDFENPRLFMREQEG